MKTNKSRVTAQGQVSVPADVRRRLGLETGAVLEWLVREKTAIVRRVGRFSSIEVHRVLFDEIPTYRRIEALKRGIRQQMKRRHARD